MDSNIEEASGAVNVKELTTALQQTVIHIDLKKTFYTIAPTELTLLEKGTSDIWKDVTLASIGLGIPTILNAIIEIQKLGIDNVNGEIFINSLVGLVSIIFSCVGAFLWFGNSNTTKDLINEIKQRPQYKV
jgi:hypothetical protein